jgi:hemolysin type calcium-binding protein
MSFLRRGNRRGRKATALVSVGALMTFQALALVMAPAASAAVVTCDFTGTTLALGVTGTPNTISQDIAKNILVNGALSTTFAGDCAVSPAANVANVTTINITGPAGVSATNEAVQIDMMFAAATVSWGAINWTVSLGDTGANPPGDVFEVSNVGSADKLTSDWGASGIDLNGDADLDVVLSGVEGVTASAGTGGDTINAGGSTAAGAAFPTAFTAVGVFGTGIAGGAGDDTLTGGVGSDIITGAAGDDVIAGGLGNDTMDGGGNTAAGDAVDYRKSATGVNGTLNGAISGEGLDATSAFENWYGSPLADNMTGDAGYNIFRPGLGDDTVTGGAGDDRVDYRDATAGVIVDFLTNKVTGGSGNDTLSSILDATGSEFDDEFIDNSESPNNNEYRGRAGDDLFDQGVDCTTLGDIDGIDGEGGIDTVDYSQRTDNLTVFLTTDAGFANLDSGDVGTCGETDDIDNVENAMLGSGDDSFTGNAFNNVVFPGGGQNTLTDPVNGGIDTLNYSIGYTAGVTVNMTGGGPAGVGDSATNFENAVGTDFNDTIIGTDVVGGTNGANSIRGRKGNDNLSGNAGPDFVVGGPGNDKIRLGSGDDDGKGKAGKDFITGGSGDDFINGGRGVDTCDGGPGNDRVRKCERRPRGRAHTAAQVAAVRHFA